MPEYLSPGVYVEEIDTGPVPIEGVSTSTAGFVGMAAKGPTDGLPVLITSFGEYTRKFGGYLPASFNNMRFLPYAVQGFFDNGGQRVYIKRVVPKTGGPASSASQNIQNTRTGLITTLSKDAKKGDTEVKLSTLRGIQANTALTFSQVKDGRTTTETAIEVASYDDSTKTVTLKTALQNDYLARYTTVSTNIPGIPLPQLSNDLQPDATQAKLTTLRHLRVGTQLTFTQGSNSEQVVVTSIDESSNTVHWADAQKLKNAYPSASTTIIGTAFVIRAIDPGKWGDSLAIQVFQVSTGRAQVQEHGLVESTPGSGNFDTVILNTSSNFYPGAVVEFNNSTTKKWGKVTKIIGKSIVLKTPFKQADALDVPTGTDKTKFPATLVSTCEFRITASSPDINEDYPILTLNSQTPYYVENLINSRSSLISVTGSDDEGEDPFIMPSTDDGLNVRMVGGIDSSSTVVFNSDDYVGQDNGPGQRTGLKALEDIEEISIIAAPGITDQSVQNELIDQCQRLRYRFAILDPVYGTENPIEDIITQRQLYDTHYAALYFPNLVNVDPNPAGPPGSTIVLPPSGHIAGIYARVDDTRGVYKAPANEVILGITDLDQTINKGEQDILNPLPNNINVLRNFRHQGRGLRVWGARCITSDTQWKYVNVRRLFIFIEDSLDRGTQWVVFEPNAQPLWDRVTQSISNFLTSVWRDGALMGAKPEEAFFVKVGYSTMTQDDIDNGRLIIMVGIAPVKPAEFVIIRISQYTVTASTTGQ